MPEDVPSRRACDRCHNIKERCQWPPDSDQCQRCLRLGHDCQTLRPIQKLGRKPRSRPLRTVPLYGPPQQPGVINEVSPEGPSSTDRSESSLTSPPDTYQRYPSEDLGRIFQDLPGFDDAERELVTVCFAKSDAAGQFTLGPTFHLRHQTDLCFRLRSAVPELKDAFVACAVIMACHQKLLVSQTAIDLCARKAAVGVASLRMIQVKRREDVTICLVLGMVITTYSLFVANGESQGICACALGLIRPWYRSSNVLFEADEYSYLICLMYTEMIECVLKSERPTLRYGEFGKYTTWVDRYMGLSPPILAFLYDICELSSSLRATRDLESKVTWDRINEIEANVRRWKPLTPADFPERFTHIEVIQIMTQIKSLRQATLLLLHRLRYPYGIQDDKGLALSDSILLECNLALQHIPRVPMGMDIAFVIACFEPREEWHQTETLGTVAETLKFSEGFHQRIQGMLQTVWRAKAMRDNIYWFDIPTYVESLQ